MDYFVVLQRRITQCDLVKIQVTCCWLNKHNYVRVAMFATVRIPAPFFGGGGGPKSILFSLFLNKKTSFKGMYTLNGVIYECFSIEKV